MTKGKLSFGMIGAIAMASATVGCIGTKNQEVADAPPPPPAAYPDTSGALAGASQVPGGNGSVPTVPAMPNAATNTPGVSASVSSPFTLREGEQLMPHQIQSGENLSSIAAKYNSSITRIQAANGMTDTKIFAGKTLQVPTSAPPTHLAQSSAVAPAPLGGSYPRSAPAPVAPTYAAAASGSYPPTMAPPSLATTPGVPTSPIGPTYPSAVGAGAISAPPVPQVPGSLPGSPASTSYPRSAPAPSFEGSRVQFSN